MRESLGKVAMPSANRTRIQGLAAGALLATALLATPSHGQERIVLDGSTGMLPLAKALATAFTEKMPGERVEVGAGLGTGARMRALEEDKVQVILASHGLQAEDIQKRNLKMIEVAKGAIVFAVHANVPMMKITESQVCDIYSGRVGNWNGMAAIDAPIVVLTRPPSEVDPEVIRAKVGCFKDLTEVSTVVVMARGGDMARALADRPHSIGMTSMTVVEQSQGKVKALALADVAPTTDNVKGGRYLLTRDFLFVVKGKPAASVQRFLDFVLSPDGDKVIVRNGAVPLR